jgi:hypothetical protein
VNPDNPRQALNAAAKNMAAYVKQFGSYEKALRAYNAGPGNVERSRGFAETNHYVQTILGGRHPGALRSPVRGPSGASGGGGVGSPAINVPGVQGPQGLPMGSEGITALLEALGSKPQPRSSAGLQAPSFSAAPALPAGAQIPQGGGGPSPAPSVDDLLAQIQTAGGDVQMAPGNEGGTIGGTSGGGGFRGVPAVGNVSVSSRGGRVVVDPRADRPGVHTHGYVIKAAQRVSAIAGTPVRIATGTRHTRMTTNGNVSAHWSGEAADIAATGRRLVRLGQAALIDAGMPEREARKQTGGLYNVNGAQIIFNSNDPALGGNHLDHLHYQPARRRRG